MDDTTSTLAPSSNNSPAPSNIPAEQTAAVSSAISQAVPPRSTSQPSRSSEYRETRSEVGSTKGGNSSEKTYGLEDFGDDNENPLDPSSSNNRTQENKSNKQNTRETDKRVEKSNKQQQNKTSKTTKSSDKELSEDSLELKIDLEEKNVSEALRNKRSSNKNAGEDDQETESETDEENDQVDENDEESNEDTESDSDDREVKPTRDYSKFKPEHQQYLKKLPNRLFASAAQEFENLYKVEQENNSLKEQLKNTSIGKLPSSYYEHESAYQLSPDYSRLNAEIQYDRLEQSHWRNQLANIRNGRAWLNLKGYNQKGDPVYEKMEPLSKNEDGSFAIDRESELLAESKLREVEHLFNEHQKEIGGLKEKHKQYYSQSLEGVKNLEKQFFKDFSDESKLPAEVKADLAAARKAIESSLPAFKGNPLTKLLEYSYSAIKAQQRQVNKLMQFLNTQADKAQNVVRAGPGKKAFQGGSATGEKLLSADMFED